MKLNRQQFIKAISFLKPAILKSDEPVAESHLHVVVDGPMCVLTSYNTKIAKSVTLFKPVMPKDIEGDEEIQETDDFLINLPTLESFETMCKKHKQKFDGKKDLSLSSIDIFSNKLESHKDFIKYEQPIGTRFPDMSGLFDISPQYDGVNFDGLDYHMVWDYELMLAVMKEFGGHIDVVFTSTEGPIYFKRGVDGIEKFEAVFIPVKRVEAND